MLSRHVFSAGVLEMQPNCDDGRSLGEVVWPLYYLFTYGDLPTATNKSLFQLQLFEVSKKKNDHNSMQSA